jgi:hypothetical protein
MIFKIVEWPQKSADRTVLLFTGLNMAKKKVNDIARKHNLKEDYNQ